MLLARAISNCRYLGSACRLLTLCIQFVRFTKEQSTVEASLFVKHILITVFLIFPAYIQNE